MNSEYSLKCLKKTSEITLIIAIGVFPILSTLLPNDVALAEPVPYLSEVYGVMLTPDPVSPDPEQEAPETDQAIPESVPPSPESCQNYSLEASNGVIPTHCLSRNTCNTISLIDLETGAVTYEDPCEEPVCADGGDSCIDCAGVPNGSAVVDQCGVCQGDNSSCLDCAGVPNGSAVVDQCGVCQGDNSSCLDCAGVPNGSSVIDECGVCGGDNSSCSAECSVYKFESTTQRYGSGVGQFTADRSFANLSCASGGLKGLINSLSDGELQHGNKTVHSGNCRFILVNGKIRVQVKPGGGAKYGCNFFNIRNFLGSTLGFRRDQAKTVFVDKSCKVVEAPQHEKAVCSSYTHFWPDRGSPISLVLGEEENYSLTNSLQLEPGSKNRYYLWKGSNSRPLLVYDPEHTGVINSPSQLFGDWTFGGKKFARINEIQNDAKKMQSSKWDNGFEALASLDANLDGELSGKEIAPLGIWFDRNRNAISEPGEVISASQFGLEALYFKIDYQDKLTKDIHVLNGFKRRVDGASQEGGLVDWYYESFSSKQEAELIYRKRGLIAAKASKAKQAEAFLKDISKDIDETKYNPKFFQLLNVWEWKSAEKAGTGPSYDGIIIIDSVKGDKFSGVSIVEVGLREKPGYPARGIVQTFPLSGKIGELSDGSLEINFSLDIGESKERIASTAILSADMELKGKTKVRNTQFAREDLPSIDFDYAWSAKRFSFKD